MATTNGPQGWRQQSPIDIQHHETHYTQFPESYLDLSRWRALKVGLKLVPKGAHPSYAVKVRGKKARLTFAQHRVSLESVHFHTASEHHIDGRSAIGEIHLVHAIDEPTRGSSKFVIGILVDGGRCGTAPKKARRKLDVALKDLLPASDDWYRYEGSLTTGGHEEIVSWVVMAEPVTLRPKLADALCAADHGDREPQPLQRRFVLRNFG